MYENIRSVTTFIASIMLTKLFFNDLPHAGGLYGDDYPISLDQSILRRISLHQSPPAGGAFGKKTPLSKRYVRLGHYTIMLKQYKTSTTVSLYSGRDRLGKWDAADKPEGNRIYDKVVSSVTRAIQEERNAMRRTARGGE